MAALALSSAMLGAHHSGSGNRALDLDAHEREPCACHRSLAGRRSRQPGHLQSALLVIRAIKEAQQVIVVAQNARIADLGDAELIVALSAAAEKATVVTRGSIRSSGDVRDRLRYIEGFARDIRSTRGGLWHWARSRGSVDTGRRPFRETWQWAGKISRRSSERSGLG
jgi:hypothetical protein